MSPAIGPPDGDSIISLNPPNAGCYHPPTGWYNLCNCGINKLNPKSPDFHLFSSNTNTPTPARGLRDGRLNNFNFVRPKSLFGAGPKKPNPPPPPHRVRGLFQLGPKRPRSPSPPRRITIKRRRMVSQPSDLLDLWEPWHGPSVANAIVPLDMYEVECPAHSPPLQVKMNCCSWTHCLTKITQI